MQANLKDVLGRELSACANLYGWGRRDFENTVTQWENLLRSVYDYPQGAKDLEGIFSDWRRNETRFPAPQTVLARLSALRSLWKAGRIAQDATGVDTARYARLCRAALRGDERARLELMGE